ncbi:phage tail tape measure protein [Clostridium neonatale]|uniref:phage tail tape measure protein n=1 Tax=Clostridium neonatale TaxID=137838 RepID=UPI00291BCC32|nr:Phage-like protein [Clostridium neonatale]CAI3700450.1 Phage-like protein [Clostridium neonatale]CAI3700585.1 Phage-like protein [Clostridium neonatale]CAI3721749.1 Phage-like protein [Clostridium neonatale]
MANKSSEYELAIRIAGMVEKSLGNSIKETQNQLGSIGNIAQKAATMIGTAFAAIKIKDFAVDCAQSAMSFEETMSDVAKVVDGLKDSNGNLTEEYYAMSDSLIEMSKNIPLTTNELGQITAAAGQANIAKEDLMQFTETAAKMGVAFDTTAEQAGTWMATWRTALNLTQDEVETLGDQINYLGNTSSENALKLSQIVNDIGSLAKISGVSGAELAALGAATTGIDANVAATGLKNMFVALGAGSSATKTQISVLKKLGFTATELAERMQVDAQGAIVDLLGAINKLPAAEQEAAIKNYFGTESLATVAVLSANLDNLKSQFEKIGDETKYAGSMEAEYQAKAATTANSIQLLKNRWEALKIQLGNYLLPIISKVVEYMSSSVDSISAYIEANSGKIEGFINKLVDNIPTIIETCKSLIPVLAGVGGAFAAFKGITFIMSMGKSLSGVIGVIKKVVFAFQSVAGGAATVGEAIAFVCNPIGLTIAAIATFIGILTALYVKNEEFRNQVNEVWEMVKLKVMEVISNIQAKIAEHQDTINTVVSFMQNILLPVFVGVFSAIVTYVGDSISAIGTIINGIIDYISGVITVIEGICTGDWSKVWEGIKEVVKGAIDIIKGLWEGLISLLKTPINAVINIKNKVLGEDGANGEKAVKVGHNAKGTKSWIGGLTYINEGNRGELIDLPNGTQITSHSQTESLFNKIANAHAEKNSSSIARLVDLLSGRNATENNNIDNSTNQEPVINYSPQFIFQGEAPSKKDMVEAARISKDEFSRMMKEFLRENKRIKLA